MAGMGTGLAPWRAVTQELLMTLFHSLSKLAGLMLPGACDASQARAQSWQVHAVLRGAVQAGASQRVQRSCFGSLVAFLQEWLYREEFESYEKEGVLQMHTAFSREQASEITPALVCASCSSDEVMRHARSTCSTE